MNNDYPGNPIDAIINNDTDLARLRGYIQTDGEIVIWSSFWENISRLMSGRVATCGDLLACCVCDLVRIWMLGLHCLLRNYLVHSTYAITTSTYHTKIIGYAGETLDSLISCPPEFTDLPELVNNHDNAINNNTSNKTSNNNHVTRMRSDSDIARELQQELDQAMMLDGGNFNFINESFNPNNHSNFNPFFAGTTPPRQNSPHNNFSSENARPRSDSELARELQAQWDMEDSGNGNHNNIETNLNTAFNANNSAQLNNALVQSPDSSVNNNNNNNFNPIQTPERKRDLSPSNATANNNGNGKRSFVARSGR